MVGLVVAVGALALASVFGLLWQRRNGSVSAPRALHGLPEAIAALIDPHASVTLVQLSTTFCTPCRQTKILLSDLAAKTEGLAHADLDITDLPDVAQSLKVLRAPTTIAYDPTGRELLRVSGLPKRPELVAALGVHLTN